MCCPGDRSLNGYVNIFLDCKVRLLCANLPTSQRLRQGKRSIFHSYHARLMGPGAFAMVCNVPCGSGSGSGSGSGGACHGIGLHSYRLGIDYIYS